MQQDSDNAAPLSDDSQPASPAAHDVVAPVRPRLETPVTRGHHTLSRWSFFVAGGVLALIATTLLSVVKGLTVNQAEAQLAGHVASPQPAADLPAIDRAVPMPTWVGRRQATWAFDGSKTIAFELQAVADVPVWMKRVKPTLVVRCLSRTTEVFIAMGTAASVGAQTGSHAVHLQIDDEPEELQQWPGSESQQELFAPDGPALIRRLARAQRMRFGFRPYNAAPVTADFSVQGFDPLAGLVASTCGWRLDSPAPSSAARVNLTRP